MMTAKGLTLTLFLAAAAGCVAVYPAMGLRAQTEGVGSRQPDTDVPPAATPVGNPVASTDRWPARWGVPGAARGVIIPTDHRVGDLRPAHLGRFHQLRTGEVEYAHAQALAKGVGITEGFRFETEGPGSFVFAPPVELADGVQAASAPGPDDAAEVFVYASAQLVERQDGEDRVAIERTWLALYAPRTSDPVGTIVLIPGMLGTPEPIIEGMIRFWRAEGYAVLRFMSHPSRFTERVEVAIGPGEEEAVASRLASIYDQRTAECAYAADAAVGHVMSTRDTLRGKPVVLVGMSGGAMVLPTVYAYAPQRYAAAVLIAGGANFLRISAESNYADWIDAVVLDWAPQDPASQGRPDPERLARLSDAYLLASRLDAMHTAGEMAGIPVLVLHATNDKAVPSALGEQLWQRLGTPERWVYAVTHEIIFVMLPTQARRMGDWINAAIGRTAQPSDGEG